MFWLHCLIPSGRRHLLKSSFIFFSSIPTWYSLMDSFLFLALDKCFLFNCRHTFSFILYMFQSLFILRFSFLHRWIAFYITCLYTVPNDYTMEAFIRNHNWFWFYLPFITRISCFFLWCNIIILATEEMVHCCYCFWFSVYRNSFVFDCLNVDVKYEVVNWCWNDNYYLLKKC